MPCQRTLRKYSKGEEVDKPGLWLNVHSRNIELWVLNQNGDLYLDGWIKDDQLPPERMKDFIQDWVSRVRTRLGDKANQSIGLLGTAGTEAQS